MSENKSFTIKGVRYVGVFFLLSVFYNIISDSSDELVLKFILILAMPFFLFYGIILAIKGKKEFGANHEKSAKIASNLIILVIITYLLSVMSLSSMFLGSYIPDIPIIKALVFTFPFAILWLAFIYLIKELANKNIQILLWLSFFLNTTITLMIRWMLYENWKQRLIIPSELCVLIQPGSIIPILLVLFCYYKTYMKIKKKRNEDNLL